MTDFLRHYGQWGLVAGASEGIGAAFCEEMARKGMSIIMVDINRKGMESLSLFLENKYAVRTKCLPMDLAGNGAVVECLEAMQDLDCRLLVYNAAYSRVKPFLSAGEEEKDAYVDVNVRTPLRLAHAFALKLKASGSTGGIILMSSLAGIWGTQLVAAYSGTKAFNLNLAEALSHELKPLRIDVSACCAGATATPGYLGTHPAKGFFGPPVMKPGDVASIALKKLGKKTVIIPGRINRITYFMLTRLLPRSWSVALVNRTMAGTYRHLMI